MLRELRGAHALARRLGARLRVVTVVAPDATEIDVVAGPKPTFGSPTITSDGTSFDSGVTDGFVKLAAAPFNRARGIRLMRGEPRRDATWLLAGSS